VVLRLGGYCEGAIPTVRVGGSDWRVGQVMNKTQTPGIAQRISLGPAWPMILKAGFVGLLIGYMLALWLSQWVWLEMRLNVGSTIPGSVVILMLLALWKRIAIPCSLMLILEMTLVVSFAVIYGWRWDALPLVFACLLREGCHVGLLRTDMVNVMLGFVLIVGNRF
jgi:hypothetical protein